METESVGGVTSVDWIFGEERPRISYSVVPGTANGMIVVDVTAGELRVCADLIDTFGLVDEPVTLRIKNGEVTDIAGTCHFGNGSGNNAPIHLDVVINEFGIE